MNEETAPRSSPRLDGDIIRARLLLVVAAGAKQKDVAREAGVANNDLSTFKSGGRWGAGRLERLSAALTRIETEQQASLLQTSEQMAPPAPYPTEPAPPEARETTEHEDFPDTLRPYSPVESSP